MPDGSLFTGLIETRPAARTRARRRNARRDDRRRDEWPLEAGINVVLFAGMGGACQGLEDAGFPVHVAVNHDAVAIATHKALNPFTRHLHADIYEVCPLEATGRRQVNILWASPDCLDHSVAKGGAPRSPRVRSMPWQVCRWIGKLRKHGLGPRVVYLENVREIRGWGPLIAKRCKATGRVIKLDGTVAAKGERVPRQEQQLVRDPKRVGRTYRAWVRHLEKLGARYEDRDLNCAEHGVPTSRKRLFGVGVFGPGDIEWPPTTHGPRDSEAVKAGKLKPFRAAAEIIDWSLPLPSIFDRKKPLAAATQRRVAVGMKRFVIEAARPFLIHLTHHGARPEIDPTEPISTVTGAHRGEMALVGAAVVPTTHRSKKKGRERVHDGEGPVPTLTAGVKGGEFAAMAATVVGAGGRAAQSPPMGAADPLNTSTTKEDRCVVAAHLTKFQENSVGQQPGAPLDTVMAGAPRFGVVGASLAPHVAVFRGDSAGVPATAPLPTVTANSFHKRPGGAAPLGVVGATLAPTIVRPGHTGPGYTAHRGQDAADPLQTATGSPEFSVVAASLVQTGYGERKGQKPRAIDIENAIGTQMAGGAKHAVVGAAMVRTDMHKSNASCAYDASDPVNTITTSGGHAVMGAWMVQNNTGVVGHDMTDPTSTTVTTVGPQAVGAAYLAELRGTATALDPANPVPAQTAGGFHTAPAAAFLCEYYGTGGQHQGCEAPLNTASTRDRFAVSAADLAPSLSTAQITRARQVAEFLREHGAWDGGDVVTVGPWVVIDIGMRMLTPREAAAAHELRMPDEIEIDGVRRPLTKTESMKLVGNSVPKRPVTLLAKLNAHHTLYAPAATVAAE
jgi:DNA (cytosine-5)-methyltransferase 1